MLMVIHGRNRCPPKSIPQTQRPRTHITTNTRGWKWRAPTTSPRINETTARVSPHPGQGTPVIQRKGQSSHSVHHDTQPTTTSTNTPVQPGARADRITPPKCG